MHDLEDVTRLPDDFDGRVRLFPLPELVLFPHAVQPLHIFEARYCEMLLESLATDRLIAMTTLTGALPIQEGQPPVASTVCISRIISHVELEDERHNILLVGVRRAKILKELDAGRTFRIAEVDAKSDVYPPEKSEARLELKTDLLKAFGDVIPTGQQVQQSLQELLSGTLGLGPITDIIAHTIPFSVEQKLNLLAEPNVDFRAESLIELLRTEDLTFEPIAGSLKTSSARKGGPKFPPPFSLN